MFCPPSLFWLPVRPHSRRQPTTYKCRYNLTGLSSALVSPRGIAVAPDGTVYAADVQSSTTGRVVMVTPSGTVGGASGAAGSLTVTTVTTLLTFGRRHDQSLW